MPEILTPHHRSKIEQALITAQEKGGVWLELAHYYVRDVPVLLASIDKLYERVTQLRVEYEQALEGKAEMDSEVAYLQTELADARRKALEEAEQVLLNDSTPQREWIRNAEKVQRANVKDREYWQTRISTLDEMAAKIRALNSTFVEDANGHV